MDLKHVLTKLRAELIDKHQFASGDGKSSGVKNVRPIDILSKFIDANPNARLELKSIGIDWPEPPVVVEPVVEPVAVVEPLPPHRCSPQTLCSRVSEPVAEVSEVVVLDESKPNADDTAEIPLVPQVSDKEILFTFGEIFYKRNRYTGAIWRWIKLNDSNFIWDFLGASGTLTCDKSQEIEAASYTAMAAYVEPKIVVNDAPPAGYDKDDYIVFEATVNGVKNWYRIHKEWHSIWSWDKPTSYSNGKSWEWQGYPESPEQTYGARLGPEISAAADLALKTHKTNNPQDTKILLLGEKKSYFSPSSYRPTKVWEPEPDVEAAIDTDTAIHVDENIVDDVEDIGVVSGKFTKKDKKEGGYMGFHTSHKPHTPAKSQSQVYSPKKVDYDDDWYYGGTSHEAESFRTTGNVGGSNDSAVVPGGGDGIERDIKNYDVTPLEGFGDTIIADNWVKVFNKSCNIAIPQSEEYYGKPMKVLGYRKSICAIDLMHEDGTTTTALYSGPGWKKLFEKVESPYKNISQEQPPLFDEDFFFPGMMS